MVEEEDVLIDDISAIVIELKSPNAEAMRSINVHSNSTSEITRQNRSVSEVDTTPRPTSGPAPVAGNRYAKRQSIFREEDEKQNN